MKKQTVYVLTFVNDGEDIFVHGVFRSRKSCERCIQEMIAEDRASDLEPDDRYLTEDDYVILETYIQD